MSIRTLPRPRTAVTWMFAFLIAFGVSSVQMHQVAAEQKPVALITISSIDEILEDTAFVGELIGQPHLKAQAEMIIGGFMQALDGSNPIGLIVQTDGIIHGGAVCIPVKNLKTLLGMVQAFGITHEEGANGTLEISAQGQTMFARESNGWAYLSMMPQMLEGLPDNPGPILADLNADYDLGVRLHVQNIPAEYREMAIQQLQAGMEAGFQQGGGTPQDIAQSKELAELQVKQLKQLINEADQVTIGIALDGPQQRALIDFGLTAVAGSELATQMAQQMTAQKTNFAGFFQPDAAMMMSFAGKVAESDKAQIDQAFEIIRNQLDVAMEQAAEEVPSEERRDLIRSAVDDFLAALKSSLQAGMMDGGAVLNMAPNSLTFVAGGFVGDPAKIESGVKKLVELGKDDPEFPGVNWNAASHGDVKFHTMNVPIPAHEEEPRQLFGEELLVAVGIGSDSAFLALGRDCIEAVKGVIDTSAASPQKEVPPLEMSFALKQIMEVVASFADESDQPLLENIANMLATQATGRDHVRIVLQPVDNGFRYRIEAEEGVLRSIGMAIEAEQMQQAEAGF